jgi:monoterpene epsilon-lactone hydrolase
MPFSWFDREAASVRQDCDIMDLSTERGIEMDKVKASIGALALGVVLQVAAPALAQEKPQMAADGSITVPSFVLPFSTFASPEAREDYLFKQRASAEMATARGSKDIAVIRANSDRILFQPWVDQQWKKYPNVNMTTGNIAGVEVQTFVPKEGVKAKNKKRVLINLHGGGFMMGWGTTSQLESIPISSVGGIKVISVNYRMFPEGRFPAASEDVEKVYRELLKSYKPSQIGIYGCSAGALLTGQSMAWFQQKGLPNPAAIGFLDQATSGMGGDSRYIGSRVGGIDFAAPAKGDPNDLLLAAGYFQGAKLDDPLVLPSASPAVMAKFPPSILITGTRAGDLSAVTRTHLDLVNAGVEARLYVWDGMDHCFMYSPLPESQQAYSIVTKFFDEMMDRAEHKSR